MQSTEALDRTFQALSNPTRRAVVERLGRGACSVSELAEPFGMALPSFMQHLEVLEECGLVRSYKRGRVRTVEVRPAQLKRASRWLEKQQQLWARRLDQLDDYLTKMDKESE
ncbi:MAG: helix-turn-helix transcriptional regulator [Phycisphaerales bacterium]|nr:helix-turn-helix transcriptional regulator [Phycisphaerales bacterium]